MHSNNYARMKQTKNHWQSAFDLACKTIWRIHAGIDHNQLGFRWIASPLLTIYARKTLLFQLMNYQNTVFFLFTHGRYKNYLNNLPQSACIAPSRCSQRKDCILQMLFHYGAPGQHVFQSYYRLLSNGEFCPVPANNSLSDLQILVCRHSILDRNPQNCHVSSERWSSLHLMSFDHSMLWIFPDHQDRFGTFHWFSFRTGKRGHSPCKLNF